jgi:hypothetical protein
VLVHLAAERGDVVALHLLWSPTVNKRSGQGPADRVIVGAITRPAR